jgi:ParB family chromosome partitioning protein
LVEALTQHKTAAIAAELSQQPEVALAATVHALALNEFGLDLQLYRSRTCLQISTHQIHLEGAVDSPALTILEAHKRNWLHELATAADDIWPWCLRQDHETLLRLLAYCVARTVNAVKSKTDNDGGGNRLQQADALASALQFDMSKWFAPTADNFFGRIPKSRIAEALAEAGKPASPDALKLKKAELAALAEKQVQGSGWLPEPVRHPRNTRTD